MKDLNNLEPGESAVYFTGHSIATSSIEAKYTAMEMYMRDEAELTQRRLNDAPIGVYDYIFTKRRGAPRPKEIIKRRQWAEGLSKNTKTEKMK